MASKMPSVVATGVVLTLLGVFFAGMTIGTLLIASGTRLADTAFA